MLFSWFCTRQRTQSVLPFTKLFLILTALDHPEPASRSIFIVALSADQLPWVWIAAVAGQGLIISSNRRIAPDTPASM